MFKRGWLNRGRIYSDEGYEVTIIGRAHLEYRDGQKKVAIGGERLTNGFVIEASTITTWNDKTPIDETTKQQIVDRIKRALQSQGMIAELD